jgi:adenylate cyclase
MTPLLRRLTANKWIALAAVFAALVLADHYWIGVGPAIDRSAGDAMLRLSASQRPVSDKVVIVDIDQKSLEDMNDLAGRWPWPRSVHGELIDHIQKQGPRAIVFDILFDGQDMDRPEHDEAFAETVARNPNVSLAMGMASDGTGARIKDIPPAVAPRPLTNPPSDSRVPMLLPLAVLSHPEAMRGGLINFTEDGDGVGRYHELYLDRAGWRFPSLAAHIVESAGRQLPDEQKIMLNWRRGWKHVSYGDIFLDSQRARPLRNPNELRDKIVVIGTAAPGLQDLRLTPLASTYPGVEILATAIDNLDRGDWLRTVPRSWMLPLALAAIGLVALGFARGSSVPKIGYALAAVALLIIGAAWFALTRGLFVAVFAPLAAGGIFYLLCGALAYLQERADRLKTATMFKRFLDPRVVTDLIGRGEIDHRTQAEAREISVLFSDIRNFTTLSENASPEEVVALLNLYFSRQVEVIFKHGGTLDKFIGDAIMAFWGAPTAYPDHAERAVAAAIEMSSVLDELRAELGTIGSALDIGVGVHTGRAVVGCIGSTDRLDYTAIGDTVNLASRIEGLTKGISRVLVSEATHLAAKEQFGWKDCGFHRVKGREVEVRLYQPLSNGAKYQE